MASIVYNYPKSSCNCYTCITQQDERSPLRPVGAQASFAGVRGSASEAGGPSFAGSRSNSKRENSLSSALETPTNMSVLNCKFSSDCKNNTIFRKDIEPSNTSGIIAINPSVYSEKFAKDFQKIECSNSKSCPKTQFASMDPRLISSQHTGQVLTLSSKPITGEVKLADISRDKTLNYYGQNYKTYKDINAGQILYYNDESIQEPLFKPNFVTSSKVKGFLYKDPMGAIKPSYSRKPLIANKAISPERNSYEGCLSFIQDTLCVTEKIL